jgi:type I restriction enzyme S subunit
MTTEWDKQTFTECVQPVRVDRGKQVKAREYLSSGKYPVVDQGQGLVAGWTDSEAAVIGDGLPYVVFGDHTRLLKYVDFPFALGADGTKLIKPKDNINPLYFYFHLIRLDIPSRGYSRHYRLLKEREISIPPLPEQKKIAAVLLKIQRAIETQEKMIQALSDLKKSTMQHVFTRGLRGEKTKMTE